MTKQERKIYNKQYQLTHKKELVIQRKEYYESHKKQILKKVKEYRKINKNNSAKYRRKYYLKHKKEIGKERKEYYRLNKEPIRNRQKIRYQENKIKILKKAKSYYQKHKNERNKYRKNKFRSNINFKIRCYLSTRIVLALKGKPKLSTTMKLVGCSIEKLKKHLERRFTKGMNWTNYGKWHVDHIKPCASFDLSKPSQQRKCFHYTNLQPLWAKENLSKGKNIKK